MTRNTANAVRDFVRILNNIDQSKRNSEIFNDFCEIAFCSIAKPASPWTTQREQLEADYMQIIKRYKPEVIREDMPRMLATALCTIAQGGCDFMGEVAGEIGALNERLGQFFTPYHVSRLMAEINFSDATEMVAAKGFITISEPAAGAGGMLLAAADVLDSKGIDPALQVWTEAVELSRSTFHMLYIQLAGRGIAAKVIHGNSLTDEIYTVAYTAAAHRFLAKNGDPFASQKADVKKQKALAILNDIKV